MNSTPGSGPMLCRSNACGLDQTPECGCGNRISTRCGVVAVAVSVAVCFKTATSEDLILFSFTLFIFKHHENFLFIKVLVDGFDQYKMTNCFLEQNVNVHMIND